MTDYTNASATTPIPQAMACSVNSSGQLVPLDVSSDASWKAFVGYANARIPTSTLGPVISNGRLQNITTSFTAGTPLYIGIDGNPTNAIPTAGTNGFVSGDMVIFMGVIVPNEANPSEYDIALFTQLIGTL
ncbi:unnamed protein product [Sphagnum balticum]